MYLYRMGITMTGMDLPATDSVKWHEDELPALRVRKSLYGCTADLAQRSHCCVVNRRPVGEAWPTGDSLMTQAHSAWWKIVSIFACFVQAIAT